MRLNATTGHLRGEGAEGCAGSAIRNVLRPLTKVLKKVQLLCDTLQHKRWNFLCDFFVLLLYLFIYLLSFVWVIRQHHVNLH